MFVGLLLLLFPFGLFGQVNIGAGVSIGGSPTQGVFNVRLSYGGVPDGSTDNSTAITNAFTASNAATTGAPEILFDCNGANTTCVYNYGGSGTSPIHPTIPSNIHCDGATLNYTGSAHALDIGASGLSQPINDAYTISGCRFTGGASYTAGIYVNNYAISTRILHNVFRNFGNSTGYNIVYAGNNWTPLVDGNVWSDTGTTHNMLDAHAAVAVVIFTNNTTECENGAGACPTATGVGVWVQSGRIVNNIIQYHEPLVRLSNCSGATFCTGSGPTWVYLNHFEGTGTQSGPAIAYGDPSTAGVNLTGPFDISANYFYWPTSSGTSNVGPSTASSGSFQLSDLTFEKNVLGNPPTGGVAWVNTNGGVRNHIANNLLGNGTVADQSTSPPIIDTGFATQQTSFNLQTTPYGSGGSNANAIASFDANGVNIQKASLHAMSGPLLCLDSSGSGTVQACNTSPSSNPAGTAFTPAAGDQIIYKTTTTNTGSLTINVNGTGAVTVRKNQGTADLAAGDLQAGAYVPLVRDATYWEIGTVHQ